MLPIQHPPFHQMSAMIIQVPTVLEGIKVFPSHFGHILLGCTTEVMVNLGGCFMLLCLDGGFKYVLFSSLFGEDSHFDSFFSDGLKPPTSLLMFFHFGEWSNLTMAYFQLGASTTTVGLANYISCLIWGMRCVSFAPFVFQIPCDKFSGNLGRP